MVTKRELVGRVFVDSGAVLLADPMYGELSDRDQSAFIDDLGRHGSPDHLGVAVRSGFGDGYYPVFIERAEFEGEEFVSRVVIDFCVSDEGARETDEALAAQSA